MLIECNTIQFRIYLYIYIKDSHAKKRTDKSQININVQYQYIQKNHKKNGLNLKFKRLSKSKIEIARKCYI